MTKRGKDGLKRFAKQAAKMGQVVSRFARIRSLLMVDPMIEQDEGSRRASADALIIDLAGPPGGKLDARLTRRADIAAFLARTRGRADRPLLLIRIPPLEDGSTEEDLDIVMPSQPDGIILARCVDGASVQQLGVKLAVREATLGLAEGATAIIAEAGAAAAGLLALQSFQQASPRLAAMTWDASTLANDIGGAPGVFADDESARTVARTLLALGARAAAVVAFDTLLAVQGEALARDCAAAKRLGFSGKVARDLDQVAIINAVFGQSAAPVRLA